MYSSCLPQQQALSCKMLIIFKKYSERQRSNAIPEYLCNGSIIDNAAQAKRLLTAGNITSSVESCLSVLTSPRAMRH